MSSNSAHSTRTAVNAFKKILPKLPKINNIKYDNIEQVFQDDDRFNCNDFMAAAVPLLRTNDNKEYKNGSLMTMVNSFQRGINEYKEKVWNEKVRSNQLPRDSHPVKFVFKTDPQFTFYSTILDQKMQQCRDVRGAKKKTKPLKPVHVKKLVLHNSRDKVLD